MPKNICGNFVVFKKLHNIGTFRHGNGYGRIFVKVEISKNKGKNLILSMCADYKVGGHLVSFGQAQECLLNEVVKFTTPKEKVERMVEIWKQWHLNDTRAGCEHQRALGWERKLADGRWSGHLYESEHPDGVLCKPCPTCGYKYGEKWLTEKLPQEVIDEIKSW